MAVEVSVIAVKHPSSLMDNKIFEETETVGPQTIIKTPKISCSCISKMNVAELCS